MKRESIETNDPQLTAYALGELEPDEVGSFERQLSDSPAARAELDDIRETVQWLRDGFATEAMRHADEASRASVLANPGEECTKVVKADFNNAPTMKSMLLGLAAVLTGLLVVGSLMSRGPGDGSEGPALANPSQTGANGTAGGVSGVASSEGAPVIRDDSPGAVATVGPVGPVGPVGSSGTVVKVKQGDPGESHLLPGGDRKVPSLSIVGPDRENSPVASLPAHLRLQPASRPSFPGFADASSYLDMESLVPTETLRIEPDKFTSLPGLDSIARGGPGYGTFHFRNPDESVRNLPEEDFGHGRMTFLIRKRLINGRQVETIRLTDHRVNPDGKEKVTVKEYTREGSEITPTGKIVPPNPDSRSLISLVNRSLPPSSVPTIGKVEFVEESEPGVVEQFQRINAELSAISQAMAKGPSPAELEALQERLEQAVERQSELGKEIEQEIGRE